MKDQLSGVSQQNQHSICSAVHGLFAKAIMYDLQPFSIHLRLFELIVARGSFTAGKAVALILDFGQS